MKNITIETFPIPESLDISNINTAGKYILLSHINRPLTKLNKAAEVEGDLLSSWSIENNFTKFKLNIKNDQKFSNGKLITADYIKQSIDYQIDKRTVSHFDFKDIKSIVIDNSRSLTIELNEPNSLFIESISYPEFGVLYNLKNEYAVTSGPYTLQSLESSKVTLKNNKFYPDASCSSPKTINFQWVDQPQKLDNLHSEKIDLALIFKKLSKCQFNKIESNKKLSITTPHIGYTFWIAINPNQGSMKSLSVRKYIQKILDPNKLVVSDDDIFWERAYQLYLPVGNGRPSKEEVDLQWNIIRNIQRPLAMPKVIKMLALSNFPYLSEIKKRFLKHKIKLEVTETEIISDIANKTGYDLYAVNNDFSSSNLISNLQTTFNKNGLIQRTTHEDNQFEYELKLARSKSNIDEMNEIFKKIALAILRKGYIAPVIYQKVIFIHNSNIDLSNWSKLYPEFATWKIKIKF